MIRSSWTPVIALFSAALLLFSCKSDDSTGPDSELFVLVETAGETVDDDGYLLIVNGTDSLTVAIDDSLSLAPLAADTLQLQLTRVAPNCSVDGTNPRTIAVETADQPVIFRVQCVFAIRNQILVASDRSGNFDIYAIDPDGAAATQLTNSDSIDWEPTISPDGTTIAFSSRRGSAVGSYDIYIKSSNGQGPVTNITNHPSADRTPSWSPLGDRIVFSSNRDGDFEIYVMNPDGSNVTQLTHNVSEDRTPSWSPDGTKILYTNDREGGDDVYVMDADGSGQTRLTFVSDNWWPRFSPDGTSIAFSTWRYGTGAEIVVMNTAGTAVTRLTELDAWSYYPTWSPDGSKIAFASNFENNFDVYIMNADGSGRTNLTQSVASYWDVRWTDW